MCVSVLRSSPGSLLLPQLPVRVRGPTQQGPYGGTGRLETETKRDRSRKRGKPPSPYIISSPERVAIISRQWPTDRSASQKGPGPIIAATHRPRRSGQSSRPGAPSLSSSLLCFFPTQQRIPPPPPPPPLTTRGLCDVDYVRTSRLVRRNAETTGEQVIAKECVVVSDIPWMNRAESNNFEDHSDSNM